MVDVMSLLAAEKRDEGQKCNTCRWLETRPADERAKWEEALADDGSYLRAHIARAIRRANELQPSPEGTPIPGPDSLSNHRGGHTRNLGGSGRR